VCVLRCVLQVDVEGAELGVLKTNFLEPLSRRQIAHLVVELTPEWWGREKKTYADAATIIHQIGSHGYGVVPYSLHKCAPRNRATLRARSNLCEALQKYSNCAAGSASVTAPSSWRSSAEEQMAEWLDADDPCSQLNTSSVDLVKDFLRDGLHIFHWYMHRQKVQEDVYFWLR
jgi:hypothetical protein